MVGTRAGSASPRKATKGDGISAPSVKPLKAADAELRILVAHCGGDPGLTGKNRKDDPAGVYEVDTQSFFFTHPRTGSPASYMTAGGQLLELNVQRPAQAAWFANDFVIADGGMYLASPVDVAFILLPILEAAAAQGQFRELSEILEACGDSEATRLASMPSAVLAVAALCDVRCVGDQEFIRLSNTKVAAWLQCKKAAACDALSSTASGAYADVDSVSMDSFAVALLGEWLSPKMLMALQAACNIEIDDNGSVMGTPHLIDIGRPEKRLKIDPKNAAKLRAKADKAETKALALKKETRNMKKMSAFFQKRPGTETAA